MEFIDHGDESVDRVWRDRLGAHSGEPEQDFIDYVPPEYRDEQRIPDSVFICQDIADLPVRLDHERNV